MVLSAATVSLGVMGWLDRPVGVLPSVVLCLAIVSLDFYRKALRREREAR